MNAHELRDHLLTASHEELCRIWRFSGSNSVYIKTEPLFQILHNRLFKEFGGFTPEISKKLGWDGKDEWTMTDE